jgi:putative ABC transport system permease protein
VKYLPLLWAGLWRKPIRTTLTMLSIAAAFLLFGILQGVISSFDGVLSKMSDTRLRVMNQTNMFEVLPIAYEMQIAQVPGVRRVTHMAALSSIFQDAKNGVTAYATDVETYLDIIPDYKVPTDQRAAMRHTRMGALVGAVMAKRFDWRIGDRITLHSANIPQRDGTFDWPLEVVGFINAGPNDDKMFANDLIFNYDYFDSARASGAGMVAQFVVATNASADSSKVAAAIDRLFANSSYETSSVKERDWIASVIREVGDLQRFVNSIVGAVLFTLLFLAGSTMSQSVRHRLPEFAVLKALGFGDTAVWLLVIAESTVISFVAAAIGLTIAFLLLPGIFKSLVGPTPPLSWSFYFSGLAIALALAVTSATLPALRARRLSVAAALSAR